MGTPPGVACPATTTANDEDPDPWPPDFNDTRNVDTLDAYPLGQRLGSTTSFTPDGSLPYEPRYDLDADGDIDDADVLRLAQVFNTNCSSS